MKRRRPRRPLAVPAPDRIEIRGLRVEGYHGTTEEEQARPQPFEVDLDLHVQTSAAADADALELTVDYASAVRSALGVVTGPPRRLLETLAEDVANAVLRADNRIRAVTVAVRKLRPPVPAELDSAGVRITRLRVGG